MMTSLPSPTAWLRWVVGDISEVAFLHARVCFAWLVTRRRLQLLGQSLCSGLATVQHQLWHWALVMAADQFITRVVTEQSAGAVVRKKGGAEK